MPLMWRYNITSHDVLVPMPVYPDGANPGLLSGRTGVRRPIKLHVGDNVSRTPSVNLDTLGRVQNKPLRGRVIYIHPEGRFHTVEFGDGARTFRESFEGSE